MDDRVTKGRFVERTQARVTHGAERRHRHFVASVAVVISGVLVAAGCSSGGGNSNEASTSRTNVQESNSQTSAQAQSVKPLNTVLPSVVEVATPQGLGSGVVIDNRGDIVTNRHVVESNQTVQVRDSSQKTFTANVVGTSRSNDLSVIRAEGANLPAVTLGDSSKVQIGEPVFAVGNPLGLSSSVTNGIVSAVGRTVDESSTVALKDLVQTSAAINPGNSGGALIDVDGKVIGIPTLAAVDPENNQPAAGIGFAIPSNSVKDVAATLIAAGGG
jgi:putative serine protease PepD